jgi:hypothetical protein
MIGMKFVQFALGFLAFLALVSSASACYYGGCGVSYGYAAPVYYAPTYYAPTYPVYYSPPVYYAPTYYAPTYYAPSYPVYYSQPVVYRSTYYAPAVPRTYVVPSRTYFGGSVYFSG